LQVFNELIICAGSVLAAKNQQLYLDPPVIVRELLFYSLSILILCAVIAYRKEDDNQSIKITIIDGLLLLVTYIFYVVVCAKFDDILGVMNMCRADNRNCKTRYQVNEI
jgi:Ca2+/Na+ antiporter